MINKHKNMTQIMNVVLSLGVGIKTHIVNTLLSVIINLINPINIDLITGEVSWSYMII